MAHNTTVFEVVLLLPNEERSVHVGVEEHIWDAAFTAAWCCLHSAIRGDV